MVLKVDWLEVAGNEVVTMAWPLTANQTVETDWSWLMITAAKETAYNKPFWTTAGTIMEWNTTNLWWTKQIIMDALDWLDILATRTYLSPWVSFLAFWWGNPDDDNAIFNFVLPNDRVSWWRLKLFFTTASTANDVKFEVDTVVAWVWENMNTADQTWLSATAQWASVSWDKVAMPTITLSTTNYAVWKTLGFYVHRNASDAADTYTGSAYLSALVFEYNY